MREPFQRKGDDMDLPEGKTCADCVHVRRCTAMFGHIPEDQSCDWSPSRFRQSPPESSPMTATERPIRVQLSRRKGWRMTARAFEASNKPPNTEVKPTREAGSA